MKKGKILQVGGGLLIMAVGLYIFFRDINLHELWKEIVATNLWVVAVVALLNPVSLWLRSLRWRLLLPSQPGISKNGLFPIVMIGFMVNNIFPARLGEAARAVLLCKRNGFSVAESVGSLILERFIDVLVFSAFFFVPVFFLNSLSTLSPYALMFSGMCAVAVLFFLLYSQFPDFAKRNFKKIVQLFPHRFQNRFQKIGAELISNLDWVFSGRKAGAVFVLSILAVMCQAVMMILLARGIQEFGLLDSMFGVSFAALGAAIPLSPGYVGTLHAALRSGLNMVGVGGDVAGAMAILYHAIGYITITTIGLYYFLSTKITFREIGEAKKELNN